jgi:rRNA processing protein Gar1
MPITEALNHIGEVQCVTGKVVRVGRGDGGITYFDFCEDHRACPFSAVIFSHDLKSIGDVRHLAGRVVEIHGSVKGYDGHAEIVVEESRQIGGNSGRIPPLPKSYDVEQKGHYSAATSAVPSGHAQFVQRRIPRRFQSMCQLMKALKKRASASNVSPSHQPPLQFFQWILRSSPHDSILPQRHEHRP